LTASLMSAMSHEVIGEREGHKNAQNSRSTRPTSSVRHRGYSCTGLKAAPFATRMRQHTQTERAEGGHTARAGSAAPTVTGVHRHLTTLVIDSAHAVHDRIE
jgi:hypothetical protein